MKNQYPQDKVNVVEVREKAIEKVREKANVNKV